MGTSERYAFGDFILERSQQRVVRADGTPLALTPRLFDALLFFVESSGRLLEKDTLMRALWPGLVVEENNLSQVVAGLRRALGDDTHGSRFIQTVPRRGFRFVAPVSALADNFSPAAGAAPRIVLDASAVQPSASDRSPGGRRHLLLASGGVLLASAAAGGWLAWRHGAQPPPVAAPAATLAVLPFRPLSEEGRDPLLEIGMADSVSARLATVPGLTVRATGSVLRYAGVAQDPLRAARELDVGWIVEGTLQRRGEYLRTHARLLRATDGAASWSGSFDARFGDVFEMQDQIAARVLAALAPVLGDAGRPVHSLVEPGGTRHPEAYQLFLTASWRSQDGRPEGIQRAIELLQQALALDPSYAQAWTELAWIHRRSLWNADAVPAAVFQSANQALGRALEIAPGFARAQAGLGFRRYWFEFDWAGAKAEFRGALRNNPNVVEAHIGLAYLLLPQGELDLGWAHMRRARELDPMSPVLNTLEASYLINHGALDEGERRLDVAQDLAPQSWLAHVARGFLYLRRHRPADAIESLRRAADLGPGTSRPKAVLAAQLATLGSTAEARGILTALKQRAAVRYVPPTSLAMVHAALGETTEALDALNEAYRWRDVRLVYLKDDPSWRALHGESRFTALLKTLRLDGLPPGLTPV